MTTKNEPTTHPPILVLTGLTGLQLVKKPPQKETLEEILARYVQNHGMVL